MVEFVLELARRFEEDRLHAESAGGGAVLIFVVDEERGRGREAGDLYRVTVETWGGLHLVEVAGAKEVAEEAAEVEGVETVRVEFAALIIEGREAIAAGGLEGGEDVEALGVEDLGFGADQWPELVEGQLELWVREEDGIAEEILSGGKAALPEVVIDIVDGLVGREIDSERGEDVGALMDIPAIGEEDAAQVPEDGPDLLRARLGEDLSRGHFAVAWASAG